jgi:hypothetical protein
VEGLFDFGLLQSLGYFSTVAILGSGIGREKETKLLEWDRPLIWMVDNDHGGDDCLWGTKDRNGTRILENGILYRLYGKVPQFLVRYPAGVKDPSELCNRPNVIHKMIEQAELLIM